MGTGGARSLDAQVNNQGTITLAQPLTLAHASAAHTNSGTIDASAADFTLNQSGTAPSFTNSGTMTIGAGRTFTINGGALNQNAGTISGTGTLALTNLTANFATNVTNATTGFVATSVTINGPGTLINASGKTMSLKTVTIGATSGLNNQGTLIANAAVTVNGPLTTNAGSTLRLLADNTTGFSTFTSANSFTNTGLIELTTANSNYTSTLAVMGNRTLTNAAGATISALTGTGGSRTINALVNNQGDVTVQGGLSSAGLQISGAFTHSGALNLEIGGLTAGTGYSRVSVTGTATLRGTLNYALTNAYAPNKGDPFDILTATSVAGTFTIGSTPVGWAAPAYLQGAPGGPVTLVRLTAP